MRYLVRFWEQWQREHPAYRQLPVVVPILLYHGQRRWASANEFQELINTNGLTPSSAESVLALLPNLRPILKDLSQEEDQQLMHDVWLASSLLLMKYIRSPELASKLPDLLQLISKIQQAKNGIQYLGAWLNYLGVAATNLSPAQLQQIIQEHSNQYQGETMATLAEQWMAQGFERGEVSGLEKGIEHGKATLLIRLLNKRWNTLSEAQEQQILAADEASIDAWVDRLFEAKSVDELLTG